MRIFACLGFTYVITLLAAAYLGFYPSLVLAAACLIALSFILLFVKPPLRLSLAAAAPAVSASSDTKSTRSCTCKTLPQAKIPSICVSRF